MIDAHPYYSVTSSARTIQDQVGHRLLALSHYHQPLAHKYNVFKRKACRLIKVLG